MEKLNASPNFVKFLNISAVFLFTMVLSHPVKAPRSRIRVTSRVKIGSLFVSERHLVEEPAV
jgi:hypothetical protein